MKTIKKGETVTISTRYGHLSRGKCWGKLYPGKRSSSDPWEWVGKSRGDLIIEQAGYLVYGSDHGFSRKERSEMVIEWEEEEEEEEEEEAPPTLETAPPKAMSMDDCPV